MPTIVIKGFDELKRNFEKAPEVFYTEAKKALSKSVSVIQPIAVKGAAVDLGGLRGSIRKSVSGLTGEVVAGSKHAIFIEEGTRPHFPPVAPLERWATRKLGSSGLGFVVARKIAREGTKAQPFMSPAAEQSLPKVERFFDIMADNLVKELAR